MSVSKTSEKILEAISEGMLSWEQVAKGALAYMSEMEIADMAHNEEFFLYEDYLDEDEDEDEDEEEEV